MTTLCNAYGPNGERIIGTLEELQGCAYAMVYEIDDDGRVIPTYQGDTEIYWNGQRSVIRDDQRVFLDQNSNEWLESQVTFMPVKPEPDASDN